MASGTMLSTFAGAEILRQTPGILRSLLANATPEDMAWQPSPDRWSINVVLAHLVSVEVEGFVCRFRAIVEQDRPLFPVYDQTELFRSGKRFDGLAELTDFEQHRRETLAWLESLSPSVGSRTGQHQELGVVIFNELLNELAFHDLGHIRQVVELHRSHAFYPQMGVFRSYYKIHPLAMMQPRRAVGEMTAPGAGAPELVQLIEREYV